MSKKYIGQVDNQNFIFPNHWVAEYDIDVLHDINDNCVSGTVNSFSVSNASATGITFSYNVTWTGNNALKYIRPDGNLSLWSLHLMGPTQNYYKPFRTVADGSTSTTTVNSYSQTGLITVTPAQLGLSSFTEATYYYEFRFIGSRCVYPVCGSIAVSFNPVTPTPTPTAGPTGCTQSNVCMAFEITGATSENFATISYNNCNGQLVNENFATNGTRYRCVEYVMGVAQIFSYTGMAAPTIYGGNCNSFSCPTGSTVTPTPTATSIPPTPTATPGPVTPTPTEAPVYTYLAACTGGTILGWIPGSYAGSLGVTINGTCYVTTYTTINPTIGSLITGTQTWGSCCPTPTPTPLPGIGYGIYAGASYSSSSAACGSGQYPTQTIYLNNDTDPNVGDVFYLDQACTPGNTYNGASRWWIVRRNTSVWAIQIGDFGTILAITVCGAPTPTPTATTVPPTPTPTPTAGPSLTAGASGSMEPCIGGTIDDYMGASVYLSGNVSVDTLFDVEVWYVPIGQSCSYPNITSGAYSQYFQVFVAAGTNSGYVNACTNGYYFPSGANICGACVTGSDNTVDTITYSNPGGC